MSYSARGPVGGTSDATMDDKENSEHLVLDVDEADAGRRLDHILAGKIGHLSRSRLQALVRQGCVSVNAEAVQDPGAKIKSGGHIHVWVPPPEPAEPKPEQIALNVVFEDDALIVVDKPAGLVVHPAPGHHSGTLVNALIAHCGASLSGIGGIRRPGIVHRLDKDTSGLLVVAKTDAAHQNLMAQFAAHGRDGKLERRYRALVWGGFDHPTGTIETALGRSSANRVKIAVVAEGRGQHAVTHYKVMARYKGQDGSVNASLLDVQLETGRTHQIRVHMAHVGHPVMGDPVYGAGFKTRANRLPEDARTAVFALKRQALHAAVLGFEHPTLKQPMHFESEPPKDLSAVQSALKDIGLA